MQTLLDCISAKRARALIAAGADVNEKDLTGAMPLHFAVYKGRSAVMNALISSGADVNAQDYYGCTPLHYAAFSGFIGAERAEIVRMLIAAGADPSIRNNSGRTPADICAGASDIFAPETASN